MTPRSPGSKFAVSVLFLSLAGLIALEQGAEARKRKKQEGILQSIENRVDAALVKAPEDNETCFSPEEPCEIKLVKFVESAKTSLDIAIYDINLDELVHAILLQSRKIPVRIVVDAKQAKGEHSLVKTLIQGGAQVRYGYQRGIMHNKFTIVDGKRVEMGSFNYTHHASKANNENQVYLSTPSIVERYVKRFDRIWSEARAMR